MAYFDGLSYIGLEDIPEGQQYRWFRDESDEFCNIQDGLNDGYKFVPYSRHEKKLKLRVESFPIGDTINYRGLVLMERPEQPILNGWDHPDCFKEAAKTLSDTWYGELKRAGVKHIPELIFNRSVVPEYDDKNSYLSVQEIRESMKSSPTLFQWMQNVPDDYREIDEREGYEGGSGLLKQLVLIDAAQSKIELKYEPGYYDNNFEWVPHDTEPLADKELDKKVDLTQWAVERDIPGQIEVNQEYRSFWKHLMLPLDYQGK